MTNQISEFKPADSLSEQTRCRWDNLSRADIIYSQPWLDLTPTTAKKRVDPYNLLGDVCSKRVFVLAGGGGQQSVAFAMLGAQVTVHDLSSVQLEKDAEALHHYGLNAKLNEGDMRDLSQYSPASFDVVIQRYSINYVPKIEDVFKGVAQVLTMGGEYHLQWSNPFNKTLEEETWTGTGYVLDKPYADGELALDDKGWAIWKDNAVVPTYLPRPREFNHKLSTVINSLIKNRLAITYLLEDDDGQGNINASPGSCAHMLAFTPPYIIVGSQRI